MGSRKKGFRDYPGKRLVICCSVARERDKQGVWSQHVHSAILKILIDNKKGPTL